MSIRHYPLLPFLVLLAAPACMRIAPSQGAGRIQFEPPRKVDPGDVILPDGYAIEVVATSLDLPTSVAFDAQGRPYVTEAGYSYGEVFRTPRLVRIEAGGAVTEIARGEHPPWNGVEHHEGAFFVAQGGEVGGGRIVRIEEDGRVTPLVAGLPGLGDHHTNAPRMGPDGLLYFGQGTATNSGVVGPDNAKFGWLRRHPEFHDIPCRDLELTGAQFRSENPLTPEDDEVVTGAYQPFGTAGATEVRGQVPCSGAILRIRPDAGPAALPEVMAWGLRNPFALAFAPDGTLYVAENGYDVRGSRPVFGAADVLWRVEEGLWYGWPDYAEGKPLWETDRFEPPGAKRPPRLIARHPGTPPQPAARFGVHSSSNGLDFSRSEAFGHVGQAFVAQFGDMAPGVGKVMAPVGYQVVRVEVGTGVIRPFAVNRGERRGPATLEGHGGLERPISARFSPDGRFLYVVDFGVLAMDGDTPRPQPQTGVLWRIGRSAGGRP